MSKRPYVSFAEVKEKVPIPEALDALGLAGRFERKGAVLTGVCPLPAHHHGPHPNPEQFKINRRDGTWLWHCFGDCQRGGDVVELVKEITGYDDAHVRFWFAEKFGDRLTLAKPKPNGRSVEKDTAHDDRRQTDRSQAAPIAPSNLPAESPAIKPLRFRLDLDPAVSYLVKRGLKPEITRRYGIGLCRRGVLKGYVAIPVYNWPGADGDNPVAYLGRWPSEDEDDDHLRYKWPEGFFKERVLFGVREALSGNNNESLLLVEGPLAVLYLAQAGFLNAVAVCGSSLSNEQAQILIATGRSIVLLFDGDNAGQNGMRMAAAKLITRRFVRVVKLPEGKQPDHFSATELAQLLS